VTDTHPTSSAGPAPLPATIGYFAAFVALGLASASLGPTLPALAELTGSGLAEISVLFVARSLGYLLGSALGGRLYDRTAGHPVMAGSLLLMASAMGLAPLAPALWLLFLAILLLGLVEGAVDVGGNTLLVWIHRQGVGPYMNALHFSFGVGAFLSPLIIAQFTLQGSGLRLAYWSLAALLLPAALWLIRLPSPPAPERAASDPADRGAGRALVLTVAFFFLYVGAEIGFGGWIYSYAVALRLSNETAAAYLTSAFWGTFTVGRLLGIPLAARFAPRTILLADLMGALASLGLMLAAPHSLAVTWIGTCGVGLCLASIFPAMISLAQRHMRITGRVTGWFFIGASAGGMTLPWLIGQCFEIAGPHTLMLILLLDLVAATAVLGLLILQADRPPCR
jgi:fucose permease